MTLRELSSGFDFWSRGYLRMTVTHLPMKFGADIFIQSGVIDIFPILKMVGRRSIDNDDVSPRPLTRVHPQ